MAASKQDDCDSVRSLGEYLLCSFSTYGHKTRYPLSMPKGLKSVRVHNEFDSERHVVDEYST